MSTTLENEIIPSLRVGHLNEKSNMFNIHGMENILNSLDSVETVIKFHGDKCLDPANTYFTVFFSLLHIATNPSPQQYKEMK